MNFVLYLSLFLLIVRAASEVSLVILAYVALKFLKMYGPTPSPSTWERLKKGYKAFKAVI